MPNWERLPVGVTCYGECSIKKFCDNKTPSGIYIIIARSRHVHIDYGSCICCIFNSNISPTVTVHPSRKAYWSGRRHGGSTKHYFHDKNPKEDISILHSLEAEDPPAPLEDFEYLMGCFDLFFSQWYSTRFDGEKYTLVDLVQDPAKFKELARKWLADRTSSQEGLKSTQAAAKHVQGSSNWLNYLKDLETLCHEFEPNQARAKTAQTLIYRAIHSAAVGNRGIPLLRQVRSRHHELIIEWEAIMKNRYGRTGAMEKKLGGFDTAKNKLGFSWLPKSWETSSNNDLSI